MQEPSVGLAFLAGLVSFLSPCVLPLVPVYLAFLTGTTFDQLTTDTPRSRVLVHAGCFILGFSAVFIAMGASASALGGALMDYRLWIERLGGLVLAVLGLWMTGLLKIGLLYREARFHFQSKPAGLAGSVLVGAAFAAGWTPCVGPVLSLVLLMASRTGSVGKGVLLLALYSAGFAVPLLLCALLVDRATRVLKKLNPYLPALERGTGVVLLLLGLALASGRYGRLSTMMLSYFPGWVELFGKLGL